MPPLKLALLGQALTYEAVRQQRIRCFDWEIADEYLSDFLNLFRAPGERPGSGGSGAGASTFLYRAHPSKPNDTLMATNYAYYSVIGIDYTFGMC